MRLIAVLGGGVKKGADGIWRSIDFKDYMYGAPGSVLRVIAANFIFKENAGSRILALGGKGQMKDIHDAPTLAEVIGRELCELGVPNRNIIEERESGTTYQQLRALAEIAKKEKPKEIVVVSNRYHLPRLRAMVEYAPNLAELRALNISFQPAEEILLTHDLETWKSDIDAAYASPEMRELIAQEQNGARQIIEDGTYQF